MSQNGNASSRIYLIGPDGTQVIELAASSYESEANFQELLKNHPALIDGAQVDPVNPRRWLLVTQEAVVPDHQAGRWSLDHLFVDQDAVVTLVEVKRKSDTRLRREVVGQMLEYAANGSLRWTASFLRDAFAKTSENAGVDPDELLAQFIGDETRVDSFWEAAESNLRAGRMRLLFVADEVPAALLRIVEFLNEHMSPIEVLALELRYFAGAGYSTHVPRVLGRTVAAVAQKDATGNRPSARRKWDRETFLVDLAQRTDVETTHRITEFLEQCEKRFEMSWGTGVATGSFTPRRPAMSARGPITVYSDGRLDISVSWLCDRPEAIEWRDRIAPRIQALGWKQPIRNGKANALILPAGEWLDRSMQLLDAIDS